MSELCSIIITGFNYISRFNWKWFIFYDFNHCVKSVQIRSFFWSVFFCIRTGEWFINFQSVSYIFKTTYWKCQLPFLYQIEHAPCYHPFAPLIMIFWGSCTKKWCFCLIGTHNIYFLVNIILPFSKKWKQLPS